MKWHEFRKTYINHLSDAIQRSLPLEEIKNTLQTEGEVPALKLLYRSILDDSVGAPIDDGDFKIGTEPVSLLRDDLLCYGGYYIQGQFSYHFTNDVYSSGNRKTGPRDSLKPDCFNMPDSDPSEKALKSDFNSPRCTPRNVYWNSMWKHMERQNPKTAEPTPEEINGHYVLVDGDLWFMVDAVPTYANKDLVRMKKLTGKKSGQSRYMSWKEVEKTKLTLEQLREFAADNPDKLPSRVPVVAKSNFEDELVSERERLRIEEKIILEERPKSYLRGRTLYVNPDPMAITVETADTIIVPANNHVPKLISRDKRNAGKDVQRDESYKDESNYEGENDYEY